MRKTATRADALNTLVAALQSGRFDEDAARKLYTLGPHAVTLALLAAARRITELQAQVAGGGTPSTPSGMRPVYTKPNTPRGRRRKRPGARDGHPGHRRPTPTRIDQRQEHRLKVCPCCGGPLQRCRRTRTRLVEDLPQDLQSVVTEHTIHRDYCPKCKQHVEPVVPDALPNATFGHRLISFTSWCHYGLGVTLDQLVDILQYHLKTKLSAGGLIAAWQRLAEMLTPWYEQIAQQARKSAYLHADETGWRVQGQTCWLWCFANGQVCYYLIDRCRGSPVLHRFFGDVRVQPFAARRQRLAQLVRRNRHSEGAQRPRNLAAGAGRFRCRSKIPQSLRLLRNDRCRRLNCYSAMRLTASWCTTS
jgi:transposase